MAKSDMFLPQYAAQAVHDLEVCAEGVFTQNKHFAYAMKYVASLMRVGVHVVLPENGEIYRGNFAGGCRPSEDECQSFVGLPAPVTVAEFQCTYSLADWERGADRLECRKRVVVAVDGKQVPGPAVPENRVLLFQICYMSSVSRWVLHPSSLALTSPLVTERTQGGYGYLCAIRHLVQNRDISPVEGLGVSLLSDWYVEITALVQCCHALRAGATLREAREERSSRLKKFKKRGVGGFTYHVLEIPTSHRKLNEAGGTHASPRLHVRRAHIRKLPSGTLTFVRQCFVGSSESGAVEKSYKLAANG